MPKSYFNNKNSKLAAIIALFSTIFSALITSPAQAISITNLDTIPHQLSLSIANQPEIITIAPNETYRSNYPRLNMRLLDVAGANEIRAEDLEEYAIWPGGKLLIQKRVSSTRNPLW